VALGAFGAHALKGRLSPEMLGVWQTAVQYHFWHALALLFTGYQTLNGWGTAAGWLFIAGLVLFSGSLYALALGAPRGLGVVTPLGGVALLLGWIALAASFLAAPHR